MAKGGSYERQICKELSLWWTGGKSDDTFWRSSQSGGRATSRAKKGKTTRGHCGDICATDSSGEPLVLTVTVEIKRGYNAAHIGEILDKPRHLKQNTFEGFIQQTVDAADRAGTPHWLLIHKRDSRVPLIYMDAEFASGLTAGGADYTMCHPYLSGVLWVKRKAGQRELLPVVMMTWESFRLEHEPADVKHLADLYAKRRKR